MNQCDIAARLQSLVERVAAEELLPRFRAVAATEKSDGSLLTEADLASQRALLAGLAELNPGVNVVAEEGEPQALSALLACESEYWVVDPLDGTSNFAHGIPHFAITLAYVRDGEARLGCVYAPLSGEFFFAGQAQGASLNGEPLRCRGAEELSCCMAIVDFKQLPAELAIPLACQPPYHSQRSFGSAALDWCYLAANRAQLYLHMRQKPWDFLAARLIFTEAGGQFRQLGRAEGLENHRFCAANTPQLMTEWQLWLDGYGAQFGDV